MSSESESLFVYAHSSNSITVRPVDLRLSSNVWPCRSTDYGDEMFYSPPGTASDVCGAADGDNDHVCSNTMQSSMPTPGFQNTFAASAPRSSVVMPIEAIIPMQCENISTVQLFSPGSPDAVPNPCIIPELISEQPSSRPLKTVTSEVRAETVSLTAVSATSRRIESLRLYLENALGMDLMVELYLLLSTAHPAAQLGSTDLSVTGESEEVLAAVPPQKRRYLALLRELIRLDRQMDQ